MRPRGVKETRKRNTPIALGMNIGELAARAGVTYGSMRVRLKKTNIAELKDAELQAALLAPGRKRSHSIAFAGKMWTAQALAAHLEVRPCSLSLRIQRCRAKGVADEAAIRSWQRIQCRKVRYGGVDFGVHELSAASGLSVKQILQRLRRNLSVEDAITRPLRKTAKGADHAT